MVLTEKVAEAWGREMRRGHTKLAVLTLLGQASLTGYDVMKEFKERTLGFWTLTSGGVYPILQDLEEKGYIQGTWKSKGNRRRKVYEITAKGRQLLKSAVQKQQKMANTIKGLVHEYTRDIFNSNLPADLPPLPLDFFAIGEYLKNKPAEKQRSILVQTRDRLQNLVQRINKRLEQIETEKR